MNTHQVIAIGIALILGVSGANAADEASSDTPITVNISGETLGKILAQLGTQYGYTFAVSPELSKTRGPHMYVEPTPAPRAFELVAAAYGACAYVDGTIVFIRRCDAPNPLNGPAVDLPKITLGIVVEKGSTEDPMSIGARGAVVTAIDDEQGAGYRAGMKAGDVIISYDREPVSGGARLQALIRLTQPGDTVPIVVLRGSERINLNVQF